MTGKILLLFLRRGGFSAAIVPNEILPEATLPDKIMQDMEILAEDQLEIFIKQYIQAASLSSCHLFIILTNDIYITKDFFLKQQIGSEQLQAAVAVSLEEEIKEFIAHAPFEHVVNKRLPLQNGFRVCLVNRDLYEAFRRIFEKNGFNVDMVIPAVFLNDLVNERTHLDQETVTNIFHAINAVRKQNLLLLQGIIPTISSAIKDNKQKAKFRVNRRILILCGAFILLLAVLVGVLLIKR